MSMSGNSKKILVGVGIGVIIAINLGAVLLRSSGSTESSQVVGWGANNYGQTGNGTTEFTAVRPHDNTLNMPDTRQVALGLNHTLLLSASGKVYGAGSNQYGQIGQNTALKQRPAPVLVAGLPVIKQIAAKQDHSVALADDGTVWTWGLNMSGQLGDGTNSDRSTPKQVPAVADVRQIAAGYRTTLALKQDGSLWAWGGDCRLQTLRDDSFRANVELLQFGGAYSTAATGLATTGKYANITPEEDCINEEVVGITSVTPRRIEGLPALRSISAGFGHMLAIDTAGSLWAWGCNSYGQIGNGTVGRGEGAHLKPAKVLGMSDVLAASAGYRHSVALKKDGTVWAWGHNYSGALGTGTVEDENPRPVQVKNLSNVKSIEAGHDFSLAISGGGDLWGWGDGNVWQFGNSTKSYRLPVRAWGLQGVSTVHAGGGHVFATLGREVAGP